jgi:hypothetical protein
MLRDMTATVLHLPSARSMATLDLAGLALLRARIRGMTYALAGRVTVVDESAGAVAATVLGTGEAPYQVELWFDAAGLGHRCSCPAAEDGTFCKHLVAVVVTVTGRAEPHEWSACAHDVVDAVAELLESGRADDVARFCEEAVHCLLRSAGDIDDPDAVSGLLDRIGELQGRAVRSSRHPAVRSCRR